MEHPILSNYKNLIFYFVDWIYMLSVFTILAHFFDSIPLDYALINSFAFCFPILFIGIALWYLVEHTNVEQTGISGLVLTHITSAVLVVGAWLSVSYYIRGLLVPENVDLPFVWNLPTHWQVFIAFVIYDYIILLYYVYLYYKSYKNKLSEELDLKNLVKEAELKALKSQINPHFLFNSLNSVSALTLTDKDKARDMLVNLSNFLRYSLSQDLKEMNTLENELNNSVLYLEIEKIRFGDKLILHFDVDKECNKLKIPNLILQPIFENAIKYGVYESLVPVNLHVICRQEEGILKVQVSNEYDIGSVAKKGEGIGLKNIQERLILLYGRDDLLYIHKRDDFFELNIGFPQ